MLWIFVRISSPESPRQGDFNKYPQHMFLGVNKEKKTFYHLSYWYMFGFFIVANSFLTAESWGTNAVVLTRFLCIMYALLLCDLEEMKGQRHTTQNTS